MAVETLTFTPDTALITSQKEKYTVLNLLDEFAGTHLAEHYAESISLGEISAEEEITPKQATLEFSKFKKEEHVDKHEVGHYTVAKSFGFEATATSIPGPGYAGLTRWWGMGSESLRTRFWRIVVIAMGGEVGAGDAHGAGSDHGQARYYAGILSRYFKEGSVGSIISQAKSEARSRIQVGSRRFKELTRLLYRKKTI